MSVRAINYENFWRNIKGVQPKTNSWFSLLSSYFERGLNLEIGPGKRPRLPIAGSHFLDGSSSAIDFLNAEGGIGKVADIRDRLPYPDNFFNTVCAFEVLEHIPDDTKAVEEIIRILKPGGHFIFSVPALNDHWTALDELAGHQRRYDAHSIGNLFAQCNLFAQRIFICTSPWLSCVMRFSLAKAGAQFLVKVFKLFPGALLFFENRLYSTCEAHIAKPREFYGELEDMPGSTLRLLVICQKKI